MRREGGGHTHTNKCMQIHTHNTFTHTSCDTTHAHTHTTHAHTRTTHAHHTCTHKHHTCTHTHHTCTHTPHMHTHTHMHARTHTQHTHTHTHSVSCTVHTTPLLQEDEDKVKEVDSKNDEDAEDDTVDVETVPPIPAFCSRYVRSWRVRGRVVAHTAVLTDCYTRYSLYYL